MGDSALTVPDFDYGELSATAIRKCSAIVSRIDKRQKNIAADIIAIGKELLAAKDTLDHGQFGPWLKHHWGWSARSAERMMQAAIAFGKYDNLSNLTIDQSALYLLSSDKCPENVCDEMLSQAESGGRITHKMVKDAITDASNDDDAPNDVSYEDILDRVIDRIRKMAEDEHRDILVARLRNLCEELSYDGTE
jgi:hypothetical protein